MRAAPAPFVPLRWAAFLAAAGGVIGVLAFPRFGIWPMAFVSVAMLSLAVTGRRARTGAWLGYLYGAGFFLPLMYWTGVYVGPVPWLILCLAFAGFWAALGAILPVVERLPAAPVWTGAAWVLEEFLRDRIPFGGLPWGRLAFSQSESPVRWFAALGGAPLVTFVVAVGGGGLVLIVRAIRPLRLRPVIIGAVLVLAVPAAGAALAWPLDPGSGGPHETVALVQGGLPEDGLKFEARAEEVLDNHVAQTLELAAEIKAGKVARPSLVLWPENASDVDPFTNPGAYRKIEDAVKAVGAPVLVGAILQGKHPNDVLNTGILWSPTSGPGAEYVKRHPVPFAEYIPGTLRSIAEAVSSDAKLVRNMVSGGGNGLLRGGPVPIGDVICFEVAYDDLVRSSVAAGAQLLVVQTNNATFGQTPETYQQLAMSQLRAVESGRTVVQVATTGKSAVIAPDGSVTAETGALYTSEVLVRSVQLRTAQTLATRVGAWPEYLLSLLAVGGVLTAMIEAFRRRRAARTEVPSSGPDDDPDHDVDPGATAPEQETVDA